MTSTKFLEKKEYIMTTKDMNKENKLKIISLVKMMARAGMSFQAFLLPQFVI